MTVIPFGEWRPDANDLNGRHTQLVRNVRPQSDGYGPFRSLRALTDALPDVCRGYFLAWQDDGSVAIFAGTSTKLYLLNNTTLAWEDVSAGGGTYTVLPATAQWEFVQFNNHVIAVQANDDAQVYTLGSSSAFADLGGSPPRAAHVAVVNRFVVLSGLASNPKRIQWSGLNDPTEWTAGVNFSDFQDLPDGGNVHRVRGGELGLILQQNAVRRMVFTQDADIVFQIDRIAEGRGSLAPYAAVNGADRAFFLSQQGFVEMTLDGNASLIGAERVDRTFLQTYDSTAPHLVIGAVDPDRHVVVWSAKSLAGSESAFDQLWLYNWALKRWSLIEVSGEYLASLATPGLTLEGLDAIAPGTMNVTGAANNGAGLIRIQVADTSPLTDGGYYTLSGIVGTTEANGTWKIGIVDATHFDLLEDTEGNPSVFTNAYVSGGIVGGSLDALPFSLDSVSTATLPALSAALPSHEIGLFSGDLLEAVLETAEQSAVGRRMFVRGLWPITDAADVRGSVGRRESLTAEVSYTPESTMNVRGYVPLRADTRHARARVRIPAGTQWTYATGVEPDAVQRGRR
ncbi:MAG TPA: hypothetical protein VNK52_16080 [Hyphomicrobiaceae bacterium]|nr:hypothetical protein [Hyphomicrobiaceae bacterium]